MLHENIESELLEMRNAIIYKLIHKLNELSKL